MRRALGMVLIAVLVVLAGCSGVLGGGGGEPTETITPAAVPTDEPTPTPVPQLAPGITGEGIENPGVLVSAHTSILQNQSFTMRSNSTGLAANGSAVGRSTVTLRAGPPGEGVHLVPEGNGTYTYSVWSKDGRTFQKRTFPNGTTTYLRYEAYSGERYGATGAGLRGLLKPFSVANTSVTEQERNGTTLYLVQGNARSDEGFRQGNISLRMLVDSRGFIHSYRTTREAPFDDDVSRIISESRYSKVGATDAPERPSWVETAKNRTTSTASSGTELAG
jgi:hypothetical protein